jgi:hypothetical protein
LKEKPGLTSWLFLFAAMNGKNFGIAILPRNHDKIRSPSRCFKKGFVFFWRQGGTAVSIGVLVKGFKRVILMPLTHSASASNHLKLAIPRSLQAVRQLAVLSDILFLTKAI